MFETFKQIGDLRRADKVMKAMAIAFSAIQADQIQVADYQIEEAYKLCLKTTFVRTNHIDLNTFWGLLGMKVREMGYPELAARCEKMYALLQARFDAGEYYADREP